MEEKDEEEEGERRRRKFFATFCEQCHFTTSVGKMKRPYRDPRVRRTLALAWARGILPSQTIDFVAASLPACTSKLVRLNIAVPHALSKFKFDVPFLHNSNSN